jgi:hypothetical protein
MVSARVFRFSYGRLKPLLSALGAGPSHSSITLDDELLRVRMSWFFRAAVPRSAITGAKPFTGVVGGWGAHGWRGTWLVNGSSKGIVSITIDPPGRARCMGVPVKLRELRVSVEEPDELIAALSDGRVDDQRQQH